MAYAKPIAADFKARFPEFTAVPDALINLVITEREPLVGESWLDRDRVPALLYLVAHTLAAQGYPAISLGGTGGAIIASTGVVKRRKVGDVEVEYAGTGSASGGGSGGSIDAYGSTTYGREYLAYRRRNFSGIAVV